MRPFRVRLAHIGPAALALTILADTLFFHRMGERLGLSMPLFIAFVALGSIIAQPRFSARPLTPYALLMIVALLALVETVDAGSLLLAVLCLAAFALAAGRRMSPGLAGVSVLCRFLASVPLAAMRDNIHRRRAASRAWQARQRGNPALSSSRHWLVWVMPFLLASGFVVLLRAGNPILERWLSQLDPLLLLSHLDPSRIAFWVLVPALVWPFLRPRPRKHTRSAPVREPVPGGLWASTSANWSSLVGPDAILRALFLFNAVFALQTLLDAVYLWGGLELPEGISYAAYAHRGAYTLIVTALLAAGFVLLALRPGTAAATDRRIRALVYLWIAQNVALVLSAMLRLDLYVDVYALTHLRLAAFVWMALVAAGLVLICVRIAARRSNAWLVGANLVTVALVFAGSCFVDDNAFIARFNVEHSRELTGEGTSLDVEHLALLGPTAIPAIDWFLMAKKPNETSSAMGQTILDMETLREWLAEREAARSHDWRGWTFRTWRLSRYLADHPMPAPPQPQGPDVPPPAGPAL